MSVWLVRWPWFIVLSVAVPVPPSVRCARLGNVPFLTLYGVMVRTISSRGACSSCSLGACFLCTSDCRGPMTVIVSSLVYIVIVCLLHIGNRLFGSS